MKKEIKKIDIKEFRELGFLQELNRQFLHPMGMALEVIIDEDGNESLGGIWDYRDDPDGIIYDIANSDDERIKKFRKKAEYVDKHIQKMIKSRIDNLGFGVEEIPQQLNPLIDSKGIKNLEIEARKSPNNLVNYFQKIKYPIIVDEDKNIDYRLLNESSTVYSLLYIDNGKLWSKTFLKEKYKLVNNILYEKE